MNKFAILNTMQRNVTLDSSFMNMKTWAVNITHTYKGVTRSRAVAYITKVKGSYVISMTGEKYKTFMGALASLVLRYASSLLALIASMIFDDNTTTKEKEFTLATTKAPVVSSKLKAVINSSYQAVVADYAKKNVTGYLKIDVAHLIYMMCLSESEKQEIANVYQIQNDEHKRLNIMRAIESLIK